MHKLEHRDIRAVVYILLDHMTVNFTQFTTDKSIYVFLFSHKNTLLIS